MNSAPDLFSYRKFWPHKFGPAPVLPMSREEMDDLGWDSCDIIIVTGDAYVDHPSFGMAIVGRLLEAQGFRVGILAQPEWRSVDDFRSLGRPNLFFGIKRIFIASGLRYDLAVRDPEYVKELVTHHVGGYLKIAPEHTEEGPLSKMMKPGIGSYDRFKEMFERFSREAGKEQYLIPYFISAHPGTTDMDMLNLALWLKKNDFRLDQVQAFLPTPLAIASAMYHTRRNPLKKVTRRSEQITVVSGIKRRQLHKALLRYHDPQNWPLLRDALKKMGRADLIGNGKRCLVPAWQPKGTGKGTQESSRTSPRRFKGKKRTMKPKRQQQRRR